MHYRNNRMENVPELLKILCTEANGEDALRFEGQTLNPLMCTALSSIEFHLVLMCLDANSD